MNKKTTAEILGFLLLLGVSAAYAAPEPNSPVSANTNDPEHSLVMQMVRRMVTLQETQPMPSPAYRLSSHLLKKQENLRVKPEKKVAKKRFQKTT